MPIDFRKISEAPKTALLLVEDPERRRILEQFLDSTGKLVEAAARDAVQELVDEINAQLAPGAKLRLVQEGTGLSPEVVALGEERGKGWSLRIDGDVISKVLVRMPSDIKERASESAQKAGMSLNNWTVSILEKAVDSLRQYQTQDQRDESGGSSGTANRTEEEAADDETKQRDDP